MNTIKSIRYAGRYSLVPSLIPEKLIRLSTSSSRVFSGMKFVGAVTTAPSFMPEKTILLSAPRGRVFSGINKTGGRLLILFGIFFCTLFFLVNGQSWATEKKTSKEQIQLERTSDLIITVQCGKSSEESVVPNCVLPHGYGTDYFFNIVEVKKGTLSDRTMKMTFFNSPPWLDNDELYSVMREKQLLKLYYVKKAKPEAPAWMSGLGGDFTDSQGVFWKLVFLEKIFADTSPRDTTTGQKLNIPYSDCRDPLAKPLKKIIGNFELAKESDFIPVIRQYEVSPDNFQHAELEMLTCTHFSVDLNQDILASRITG